MHMLDRSFVHCSLHSVCVCVCVCGVVCVVWCGVVWCGVVWCGVCVQSLYVYNFNPPLKVWLYVMISVCQSSNPAMWPLG